MRQYPADLHRNRHSHRPRRGLQAQARNGDEGEASSHQTLPSLGQLMLAESKIQGLHPLCPQLHSTQRVNCTKTELVSPESSISVRI